MIAQIKEWIINNNLDVNWISDNCFSLDKKDYLVIEPKNGKVFDQDFNLIISDEERESILVDYYCFLFGGIVYYTSVKEDKVTLNQLKYIGKAKELTGYHHLGIHGGYELCSGSKPYSEWCKKAKWLGIDTLGLIEKHTLAGTLKFQQACQKANIKPVIGESISVKGKNQKTNKEYEYRLKLYVKNQKGWENLLKIHKNLNIDNHNQFVDENVLLWHTDNLYAVIQNDVMLSDEIETLLQSHQFETLFYQFDPVTYSNEKRDKHCLDCLKNNLTNYQLPLALITDSYYLDKEDSRVKKILSFIGKSEFQYQSQDQHFKSFEEIAEQTLEMFTSKGEDFAFNILAQATEGLEKIVSGCDFKIKTGEIHLPKYEMTDEEKAQFKDNEELFWHLIDQGLNNKIVPKHNDIAKYVDRIEKESTVILNSGLEDYFLILYDLMKWCRQNNILTGVGRGSAAGSLISYCLSITEIDPLEYNLLFERFVNAGRLPKLVIENGEKKLVGGSLADVDIDVTSEDRDNVKKYIEQRYGSNNVCSIGTYAILKTKSAFRETLRYHGEQPQNINYFAGMLEESEKDITDLFLEASKIDKLKEFFDTHSDAVNDTPLILNQPKSSSIHASGVVVTPTINNSMEIWDWFPCKMIDDLLISEFEGPSLDEMGFLKIDVLGLSQLDKFVYILKLIKENRNEIINLNEINLSDKNIWHLFQKGLNQDVFQFSGDGLAGYCRDFKPENIEDLTLINAIYRPGPMGSGAHNEIVKIKNGKKELEYDFNTEDITENTYGFAIFQEQVMQICVKLGGFNLLEADDIRKAMGKKQEEKIKPYRERFVEGAKKNGCPEYEAIAIWNKLELFAGYGFNKSHSVSYAKTGYFCQWLKYYYSLEFWTIALQEGSDEIVPKYISEMRKFEGLNLQGPNINKSGSTFFTDFETNTIYWSLSRIKHAGDVGVSAIVKERDENGQFFSLEEFVKRTKGKSVNSRVVKHLILSGAFDELYNIKNPLERRKLIKEFQKLYNVELEEFETKESYREFFWYKKQRDLCGFGFFEYENLLAELGYSGNDYISPDSFQLSENVDVLGTVCGILTEINLRKTKKGEMGKLTLDNNNEIIDVVLWNDIWDKVKKDVEENIGNGIVISGKIGWDNYNKKNTLYSTDKTEIEIF